MQIGFLNDYPFSPPKVKFITPIEHPYVDYQSAKNSGIYTVLMSHGICDTAKWFPGILVEKILAYLANSLSNSKIHKNQPSYNQLLEQRLDLLKMDHEEYQKIAKETSDEKSQNVALVPYLRED